MVYLGEMESQGTSSTEQAYLCGVMDIEASLESQVGEDLWYLEACLASERDNEKNWVELYQTPATLSLCSNRSTAQP